MQLRSKDTAWHEKQLPERFAAGTAPALLCNQLFYHSDRVLPAVVRAERSVAQSHVAVTSRTAGALNPFGAGRDREREIH